MKTKNMKHLTLNELKEICAALEADPFAYTITYMDAVRPAMPHLIEMLERAACILATLEKCVGNAWDEGPEHEGWQSDELSAAWGDVHKLLAEIRGEKWNRNSGAWKIY